MRNYSRNGQKQLKKAIKKGGGNVGVKLMWTGLTWILAIIPMLDAIGLHGSQVLVLVGAILMVLGNILMWLDK